MQTLLRAAYPLVQKGAIMRMKFAAAIFILLVVPCFCSAQAQQQAQPSSQSQSAQQSPSAPAPQSPQAPLPIDSKAMSARLLYGPNPPYPVNARAAHISGTVVLHAIIGEDGRMAAVEYVSGPPLLAKVSTDTVKQWVYQPVLVQGKAVKVDTTISVVFTLGGPPPPTSSQKPRFDFLFKTDLRDPHSSHVILTESVEVGAVGDKKDWADFISNLENAISDAWLRDVSPSLTDKKGKVTVGIVVRRDGQLDGPVVMMQSSGDPQVDTATKAAVQKAAPFHSLPTTVQFAAAVVRVTLSYNHPHPVTPSPGDAK